MQVGVRLGIADDARAVRDLDAVREALAREVVVQEGGLDADLGHRQPPADKLGLVLLGGGASAPEGLHTSLPLQNSFMLLRSLLAAVGWSLPWPWATLQATGHSRNQPEIFQSGGL